MCGAMAGGDDMSGGFILGVLCVIFILRIVVERVP